MGLLNRAFEGTVGGAVSGIGLTLRAFSLFIPKEFRPEFKAYEPVETSDVSTGTTKEFGASARRSRPAPEPRELSRNEIDRDFLLRQQWDRRMDNKGKILWVLHPNSEDAVNTGRIHTVMNEIRKGLNSAVSNTGGIEYDVAKVFGLEKQYGRKSVYIVEYGSAFGKQIERSMRPRGHGYHASLDA